MKDSVRATDIGVTTCASIGSSREGASPFPPGGVQARGTSSGGLASEGYLHPSLGDGTAGHGRTSEGGIIETIKHFGFINHLNAVEREGVRLPESGCKFTAGIWM
jgi:hypothetical protein